MSSGWRILFRKLGLLNVISTKQLDDSNVLYHNVSEISAPPKILSLSMLEYYRLYYYRTCSLLACTAAFIMALDYLHNYICHYLW